jgi:tetratricopeptide (TPR) repeat protein
MRLRKFFIIPRIVTRSVTNSLLAASLSFSVFAAYVHTDAVNPASVDELLAQGRAAFLASDLDRAESAYTQACPADLISTYPVARAVICETDLASVDEARGNLVRAQQRYVHAASTAEQAGPAYLPLYCARLIDLGEHYHRQGRTAEAEASLQKAVELARKLTAERPGLLPEALIRLGGFYAETSQPERGRGLLEEALAGHPAIADTETAYGYNRLGMIELAVGREREAEANLRQSIALGTSALGEDSPMVAAYQTNLALALLTIRQFDRAGLLLRRAEFIVESHRGAAAPELAPICAELSAVANADGKFADAQEYARRAISLLSMQARPNTRALFASQVTLAAIYLRVHNTVEAERILPATVEMQRQTEANPLTLAASLQLLGELRLQQRNWHAAETLFREAIGIYEKNSSPADADPAIAALLRGLAEAIKHQGGSKKEVRELEARAREILHAPPA